MKLLLTILTMLLTGCSAQQWNNELSTPQDRDLARTAIADLRSGNIGALKGRMEPQLFAQTLAAAGKIKGVMPAKGEPKLMTVNVNTFSGNGATISTKVLNYELGADGKWAVVQIVLQQQSGNATQIAGWHVTPTNGEPAAAGNFSFRDRSPVHYFWIAAMLASTFTSLAALIMAARAKGLHRRWLWIVGSMIGLGQFSLNWTTGSWGFRPLAFQLFGSAAIKASPFDSWVLTFSLPIVAIVFLVRRAKIARGDDSEATSFL